MFAHIAELLRAHGAELRDVISVGRWLDVSGAAIRLPSPGDVREALLAQEGLFPASAAVQVARVPPAGAMLAFEAIAFAPEDPAEHGRWRAAALPAPSPLAPYYASARDVGGYVSTCGEVPTGATDPDHSATVATQANQVYVRLRADLAAHGASPANVLHQTVFLRHARDRDAITDAARASSATAYPPRHC